MSKKRSIFYSAILLTGVNLLLRMVGTSFQVYLSGTIGAEGVGLLQLVLSVGSMALVAGMAGIRTATMYLTAEEIGKRRPGNLIWVLSGCALYSIAISSGIAAALYIFAPFLAQHWIGNIEIVDSLRLCAAFLPVNCLCGMMVGYFTGANRITTLAVVEVAEQVCSMTCTVLLLQFWAGHDPARSCLSVVAGSGIGACMTLLCLIVLRLQEKQQPFQRVPVSKRLLETAVPLAIADDLRTGISTIENLIVPKRLALFQGTQSPLAAFGTVCGMVFPILTFPMALLFGLTELLIPELARCNAAGSKMRIDYLVKKSLRIALLFGCLCGVILFLCAEPLCLKLYGNGEAGRYLKWFAPLSVMLYCDAVTDAMIKGLGEQKASVRYNILTNTMDVAFLYVLLPRYGIFGYFVSFTVTHVINFILSIRRLLKITGISIRTTTAMTTILSAVASVFLCKTIANPLMKSFCCTTVLSCLLVISGVLQKADLVWLKGLIKRRKQT